MRTVRLTKESTKDILENLLKRSPNNYGKFEAAVADILANVKEKGDEALFSYTKEFDKVEVTADTIRVTEAEIQEAYEAVDASLLEVIRKALVNIRSYHEKQRQNSWFTSTENGTMLGQKVTPLNRVGVYVPGGKAVYPSSVLMNIVPAKVAGVPHIVMTTPPGKDGKVNPSTLVAAKEAGADEIYKVGGAQAIGVRGLQPGQSISQVAYNLQPADMSNQILTVIDRAIALHKMIRLFTLAGGGEAYLNFMGNEFGHPEWIDFPREGNGWSFHYCRRQWSLRDNECLKYQWLGLFDEDMIGLAKSVDLFKMRFGDLRLNDSEKKILVFYRQGLMFAFNFDPSHSYTNVKVSLPHIADYEVVLDTDAPKYGGNGLIGSAPYPAIVDKKGNSVISLYLPARSAVVLKEGKIRVLPPAPKKKGKK